MSFRNYVFKIIVKYHRKIIAKYRHLSPSGNRAEHDAKDVEYYLVPRPFFWSIIYHMVSVTYSPQEHKFKVFIFLLDEIEMAQNNSLFVWKTSNYSRGRSNLRIDMNQVTNLKSLCFTRESIANLLGVFPEIVLCDIDFSGFFDVVLHISLGILTTHYSRVMHWQPAVFTVFMNWLFGRFVSRQKANQNRERENRKWQGVVA